MYSSLSAFAYNSLQMGDLSVQKFYPTTEELSTVCSKVKCPQTNCKALFQCTSNLNMHLIKHHKIKLGGLTAKNRNTQYFCPAIDCPYHRDSKKYFTRLKYLKQHFLKVHALKGFVCKKCEKKFSTETFLALHLKNCGKTFTCICGFSYTSREAVLTHIKRKGKGHEVVESNKETNKMENIANKGSELNVKKERFIYPKLTRDMPFPVHYIAAVALSELSIPQNISKAIDKGIQTETADFDSSRDQGGKSEKKRKSSQQTQTTSGKSRKQKISTQTQTNNDYLKRKGKGQLKTLCKKRKKSMETQTKEQYKSGENEGTVYPLTKEYFVLDKNLFSGKIEKKCNQSLNISEVVKSKNQIVNSSEEKWLWEMVSSSTNKSSDLDLMPYNNISQKNQHQCGPAQESQVNQVFDLNKLCNIETQTDIDAFLTECNEDTNFTLCSTTETQTTDDFDCMLYSNMCTQTCEEVDQFFNFNFVHNETQTAWPDLNDCHELDSP